MPRSDGEESCASIDSAVTLDASHQSDILSDLSTKMAQRSPWPAHKVAGPGGYSPATPANAGNQQPPKPGAAEPGPFYGHFPSPQFIPAGPPPPPAYHLPNNNPKDSPPHFVAAPPQGLAGPQFYGPVPYPPHYPPPYQQYYMAPQLKYMDPVPPPLPFIRPPGTLSHPLFPYQYEPRPPPPPPPPQLHPQTLPPPINSSPSQPYAPVAYLPLDKNFQPVPPRSAGVAVAESPKTSTVDGSAYSAAYAPPGKFPITSILREPSRQGKGAGNFDLVHSTPPKPPMGTWGNPNMAPESSFLTAAPGMFGSSSISVPSSSGRASNASVPQPIALPPPQPVNALPQHVGALPQPASPLSQQASAVKTELTGSKAVEAAKESSLKQSRAPPVVMPLPHHSNPRLPLPVMPMKGRTGPKVKAEIAERNAPPPVRPRTRLKWKSGRLALENHNHLGESKRSDASHASTAGILKRGRGRPRKTPFGPPERPIEVPSRSPLLRTSNSCWTCKLRRKKCDSRRPGCLTCENLGIECMGYEPGRPDYMISAKKNKEMRTRVAKLVQENRDAARKAQALKLDLEDVKRDMRAQLASDGCSANDCNESEESETDASHETSCSDEAEDDADTNNSQEESDEAFADESPDRANNESNIDNSTIDKVYIDKPDRDEFGPDEFDNVKPVYDLSDSDSSKDSTASKNSEKVFINTEDSIIADKHESTD